jgi:hypothetical protein
MRGPIFTGRGKRPALIPAHQVERDTGTNSSTWGSRSRRPKPISLASGRAESLGSIRALASDFAGLMFDAVMVAFIPDMSCGQKRTTNAQCKKIFASLLGLGGEGTQRVGYAQ